MRQNCAVARRQAIWIAGAELAKESVCLRLVGLAPLPRTSSDDCHELVEWESRPSARPAATHSAWGLEAALRRGRLWLALNINEDGVEHSNRLALPVEDHVRDPVRRQPGTACRKLRLDLKPREDNAPIPEPIHEVAHQCRPGPSFAIEEFVLRQVSAGRITAGEHAIGSWKRMARSCSTEVSELCFDCEKRLRKARIRQPQERRAQGERPFGHVAHPCRLGRFDKTPARRKLIGARRHGGDDHGCPSVSEPSHRSVGEPELQFHRPAIRDQFRRRAGRHPRWDATKEDPLVPNRFTEAVHKRLPAAGQDGLSRWVGMMNVRCLPLRGGGDDEVCVARELIVRGVALNASALSKCLPISIGHQSVEKGQGARWPLRLHGVSQPPKLRRQVNAPT